MKHTWVVWNDNPLEQGGFVWTSLPALWRQINQVTHIITFWKHPKNNFYKKIHTMDTVTIVF